jgi:hypothetical protein
MRSSRERNIFGDMFRKVDRFRIAAIPILVGGKAAVRTAREIGA